MYTAVGNAIALCSNAVSVDACNDLFEIIIVCHSLEVVDGSVGNGGIANNDSNRLRHSVRHNGCVKVTVAALIRGGLVVILILCLKTVAGKVEAELNSSVKNKRCADVDSVGVCNGDIGSICALKSGGIGHGLTVNGSTNVAVLCVKVLVCSRAVIKECRSESLGAVSVLTCDKALQISLDRGGFVANGLARSHFLCGNVCGADLLASFVIVKVDALVKHNIPLSVSAILCKCRKDRENRNEHHEYQRES